MKAIDFIQRIESKPPLESASSLYDHFKKGNFTPEDILEIYRQRDSPKFIEMVKLFERGNLFHAQRQSFESWAMGDLKDIDRDEAGNYLSIENSAQQSKVKGIPESIRNFVFIRIHGKRPGLGIDGLDKIREKYDKDTVKFKWNTW